MMRRGCYFRIISFLLIFIMVPAIGAVQANINDAKTGYWHVESRTAKSDGIEYPSSCVASAIVGGHYKLHLVQTIRGEARFLLQYPAAIFEEADRKNRYPLRLAFDNRSATMRPFILQQDAHVWAEDALAIDLPQQGFDLLALQMADRLSIEGMTQPMVFPLQGWATTVQSMDQCVAEAREKVRAIALERQHAEKRATYPEILQRIMNAANMGDFTPVDHRITDEGESYIWRHRDIDGAIYLHEKGLKEGKTLAHFAGDFVTALRQDCVGGLAHEIGTAHNGQNNPLAVLKAEAACARATDRVMAAMAFVAQDENVVVFLLKADEKQAAKAIEARNRIAQSVF